MKKVHKSWALTLATFLIGLLLVGSYIFTFILIINYSTFLETMQKEYIDKIAELEYKILNCRLNTINELLEEAKPINIRLEAVDADTKKGGETK